MQQFLRQEITGQQTSVNRYIFGHFGLVFSVPEPLQGLGKGKAGALPALPPNLAGPALFSALPSMGNTSMVSSQQPLWISLAPASLGASSCPGPLQPSSGTSPTAHSPQPQTETSSLWCSWSIWGLPKLCSSCWGSHRRCRASLSAWHIELKVFPLPLHLSPILMSHPCGAIRCTGRVGIQEQHPMWPRGFGTLRPKPF